ncbi:MAG TPA: hypothetical protein VH110_08315 [Candidatus Acidoferrum sp.]|jgi:hypothetical protein|nr:hypothetical protein [Candidatus Acidoferrum sp.]
MSRKRRLILIALGIAGVILAVLVLLSTPASPPAPPPAAPPRAEVKRALQADAEGRYVPGYEFEVNGYRFTSLSLHPEAVVTFASTAGSKDQEPCAEARISAATLHLRCDFPRQGTVTIDGSFLTRFVTSRLDAAVLSATVTVRSGSGDVVHSARDSFVWQPTE